MKTIPTLEVTEMRRLIIRGYNLREISAITSRPKSTISLYCRDLYEHPQRKFKTEQEARQRIVERARGHRVYQRHPCPICHAMMATNSRCCIRCYQIQQKTSAAERDLDRRRRQQERNEQRAKERQERLEQKTKHLIPIVVELCLLSPNQRHYWRLNAQNMGTCKWCGVERQMAGGKAPERSAVCQVDE